MSAPLVLPGGADLRSDGSQEVLHRVGMSHDGCGQYMGVARAGSIVRDNPCHFPDLREVCPDRQTLRLKKWHYWQATGVVAEVRFLLRLAAPLRLDQVVPRIRRAWNPGSSKIRIDAECPGSE